MHHVNDDNVLQLLTMLLTVTHVIRLAIHGSIENKQNNRIESLQINSTVQIIAQQKLCGE